MANDPTSNGYADSLDQLLDALSSLIKEGYTKEAQHLSEYTLNRMEDLLASIDSDTDMVALQGALHRLQNMYLKAWRSSRPDADALAKQLLEWRLNPH